MAVKIKLKRLGKMRAPYYRVVIADSRTKRDGRAIEEIGKYHPTHDPSVIDIDSDRAQHWLKVGAQPTEAVMALLKVTGDWQKFKGLPGAEGTLRVTQPKVRQGGVPFVATGNDATSGPNSPAKAKVAAPAVAAPAEPVAQAPAEPVAQAPAAPVAQAPAEPVAQAPAEPVAQAPAEPVAQAPAEPGAQAAAEPAADAAPPETSDGA